MSLVLGMTNVALPDAFPVGSPPNRDSVRISALTRLLAQTRRSALPVYSVDMNMRNPQKQTAIECGISRRGARVVRSAMRPGERLRLVLGDYFRFPSEYLRQTYSQVVPFLSELSRLGALAEDVAVFLPFLNDNPTAFLDLGQLSRAGFRASTVDSPGDNPLYAATETVPQRDLGLYENSAQIAHKGFVELRLAAHAPQIFDLTSLAPSDREVVDLTAETSGSSDSETSGSSETSDSETSGSSETSDSETSGSSGSSGGSLY